MVTTIPQLNIDFSRKAAKSGIERAEKSANELHNNWSDQAFEFFKEFIQKNPKFMAEDVRFASQGIVPPPPSQRAWGAIVQRAARENLIVNCGYEKTKNVNAHRTPAAVWRTVNA